LRAWKWRLTLEWQNLAVLNRADNGAADKSKPGDAAAAAFEDTKWSKSGTLPPLHASLKFLDILDTAQTSFTHFTHNGLFPAQYFQFAWLLLTVPSHLKVFKTNRSESSGNLQ
jgi:hypothetical protein